MYDTPRTPRGVQLVIVGHSHAHSYGGHSGRSPDDYEMNPIDEGRGFWRIGGFFNNPGYWDAAVAVAQTFRVAVCWAGNQHWSAFVFLQKQFDFALASHPWLAIDQGVELVPELQVREVFQPYMSSHLENVVLRRMLDTGGPRPIILGTPPPRQSDEGIRHAMQSSSFFTNLASELGLDPETAPLASAYLRLKLWFLLQQMMRETAERFSLEFWPVSASAMTEDGYLRPEYCAVEADFTHANTAYGALMLNEYEKRLFAI